MDTIREIHKKLEEIQKEHDEKNSEIEGIREKAISQCHFIAETIKLIAPGQIEAQWYGSYDNPGVFDYPNVTIYAMHRETATVLGIWRINTGGKHALQSTTAEDITTLINENLEQLVPK